MRLEVEGCDIESYGLWTSTVHPFPQLTPALACVHLAHGAPRDGMAMLVAAMDGNVKVVTAPMKFKASAPGPKLVG